MDRKLSKFIDDNFDNDPQKCWDKVFQYEALLLSPNESPLKCIMENCKSEICDYCYKKSNKCSECV